MLTEIKFKEGETVEVNKVVAVLDGNGASAVSAPPVAETARQADEFVHTSPWTAVGVAAVAGLLIGFLTARSRMA